MSNLQKLFCLPWLGSRKVTAEQDKAVSDSKAPLGSFTSASLPYDQKIRHESIDTLTTTQEKPARAPSILSTTTTLCADDGKQDLYGKQARRVGVRSNDHRLYQAAAGGHLEEVQRLLQAGFNPSDRTIFDWSPLHWAAHNDLVHGHEIVKLLVEYGADIDQVSDTGCTPLDMARRANRTQNVKFLEKLGAKPGMHLIEEYDSDESV
ncbi:hypothetical protein BP6252_11967 [Coleophoma cylindrospora]|uniref:Uncharacterized protein n=1 Tax=Coleophoma cylindrospora TaxID=1849047 RepID=A0A3D8QGP2_9HELO|nr:hypothetical protein BP6252_11967 [Coleophoma cylindrospora]